MNRLLGGETGVRTRSTNKRYILDRASVRNISDGLDEYPYSVYAGGATEDENVPHTLSWEAILELSV